MSSSHSSLSHPSLFFTLMLPRLPISTLFPYTTLFRSDFIEEQRTAVGTLNCANLPRELVESHLFGHRKDRKSTRLNSSHVASSYAVFCLKKKNKRKE